MDKQINNWPEPAAPIAGRRFLVVTPARNEADLLPGLAHSMVHQTIRPAQWIIVDDGSTDGMDTYADELAARYSWIKVVRRTDRGRRVLGSGVIVAFDEGREAATEEHDFIAKVDADLTFGPRYIERLCERFDEDPELGSASGKVFRPEGERRVEEFMIDDMVAGQWKAYRRECFEGIGGLVREVMWDGIDFHRARMEGWKTRSFRDTDLEITHHRLMGSSDKNVLRGRLRLGRGQWFMGSHPLYLLASAAFRCLEKPHIIGGVLMVAGYMGAWMRRAPRYADLEFRRSLQTWQLQRLGRLVTKGAVR